MVMTPASISQMTGPTKERGSKRHTVDAGSYLYQMLTNGVYADVISLYHFFMICNLL